MELKPCPFCGREADWGVDDEGFFLCDCGKETDVDSQSLRMGSTRSCGCLRRERIRERNQGKEKK